MKTRGMALLCAGLLLATSTLWPMRGFAAEAVKDYSPHPKEAYAKDFIAKCQGEQWFLNEVERLLNAEQKTIDTITTNGAFSRITSLGLSGKEIHGKIPEAIGELKELRYLFLGNNHLSGPLPAALYTLEKLENIDLSKNAYRGSVPIGFANLPELTILLLWGNGYSGTIPAELAQIDGLEVLDLSQNQLIGGIPKELADLTQLRYLGLSENRLGGILPPELEQLSHLEVLSAWNCDLEGSLAGGSSGGGTAMADPGQWNELKILDLAQNRISGGIPSSLGGLSRLEELNLSDNLLTGTIPDLFGSMMVLKEVHLTGNKLRGMAPDSLKARAKAGETGSRARIDLSANYLTGQNLLAIEQANRKNKIAENFADKAEAAQYRLSGGGYIQIATNRETNLAPALRNVSASPMELPLKPRLTAEEYVVGAYDRSKLSLRQDGGGIYVTALEDILYHQPEALEVSIQDNTGSVYSKAVFSVGTEAPPSGGGGGGGNGSVDEPKEQHRAYIGGYPDGTIRPEGKITREETAAMLANLLQGTGFVPSNTSSFSDVEEGRWSCSDIEYMKRKKIMSGDPSGTFRPEANMTREEFTACIVHLTGLPVREEAPAAFPLTDVAENWAKGYVYTAYQEGYLSGYGNHTFRGSAPVSRGEAVGMVNRVLSRVPDREQWNESKSPFPDITADHWAYYEILEAAVEHAHKEAQRGQ